VSVWLRELAGVDAGRAGLAERSPSVTSCSCSSGGDRGGGAGVHRFHRVSAGECTSSGSQSPPVRPGMPRAPRSSRRARRRSGFRSAGGKTPVARESRWWCPGDAAMTADRFVGVKAVFFDAVGTVLHPIRGAPARLRRPPPSDTDYRVTRTASFRGSGPAYLRRGSDRRAGRVGHRLSAAKSNAGGRSSARPSPERTDECFDYLIHHFSRNTEAWEVPPRRPHRCSTRLAGRGFRARPGVELRFAIAGGAGRPAPNSTGCAVM